MHTIDKAATAATASGVPLAGICFVGASII